MIMVNELFSIKIALLNYLLCLSIRNRAGPRQLAITVLARCALKVSRAKELDDSQSRAILVSGWWSAFSRVLLWRYPLVSS